LRVGGGLKGAGLPMTDKAQGTGMERTVRKALGLRSVDMAEDLKVTPSMVFQLERSEWENSITLRRLQEVARSMECQLVYSIVPMEGKFEDQGACVGRCGCRSMGGDGILW
jgi:DNA-binding XRE family transcriptional regulator